MSTPLPSSSPSLLAASNTARPLLATITLASPLPAASSGSTSPWSWSTISRERKVVLVVLLVLVLVAICLLLIYCKIRRCKRRRPLCSASPSIPLSSATCNFTLDQVEEFTSGFSEANLLAEGGFGRVYRGVLPNGRVVAVKRWRVGSRQGESQFWAEVEILSQVHHRHIVSLVGYCITRSELILVYELVANNTLHLHLHGEGQPTLDWPTRLKIALGSAKGVAYLHADCDPKIIHRDIKAANILMDFDFEVKIADFGLARFTSESNRHVSSRLMGTFGYIAPEHSSDGIPTEKSDVFSFGVVLLELITGRKPVFSTCNSMADGLVEWARPQLTQALKDGNFDSLVDHRLQNNYDDNEMACMVACAAACVHQSARRRPKMSEVVRALEGDLRLSELNDGIRSRLSILYRFWRRSDNGTSQDLGNSQRMPLATQEYGSSHYSESTASEYALHPSGLSSVGSSRRTTRDLEMGKIERESRFHRRLLSSRVMVS
ncbi:proline-rich receptor-like protein kinase PERK1 isoform X2 [Eucalyptus grandis]|uniref:proline-rich receptor-like protein kinase PERK1 isoform X2 n=1 Tax=Eucalyptus grandis TaxID=71139 RepID=UPI00192EBFE7|nr:proline-rich receptor-like protein kinase PERK1 isoform X2 [Eucalyptus grandis]